MGINRSMMNVVGPVPYLIRRIEWRIRRIFGLRPRVKLANGLNWTLPLDDLFASDVFVTAGNVDLSCEHILMAYLKDVQPEGAAIDVGAHTGYYSLLFSTEVPQVYAFEPDARNFSSMAEVAECVTNIEVIHDAVGDFCGRISFSQTPNSDVSHVQPDLPPGENSVPITTLDAFALERGIRVAAVKIDVEGFDILVLEGASQIADRDRPVFSVEYGLEDGTANSWERLQGFLDRHRYVIWAVDLSFPDGRALCRLNRYEIRELKGIWTKMLFVVPEENGWFARLMANMPAWDRSRLGYSPVDLWRVPADADQPSKL